MTFLLQINPDCSTLVCTPTEISMYVNLLLPTRVLRIVGGECLLDGCAEVKESGKAICLQPC